MSSQREDFKHLGSVLQRLENDKKVSVVADNYLDYFESDEAREKRQQNAKNMTINYYDLATDFYEYGWGESFHFSVLKKRDTKEQATLRHEYHLAMKLGLVKGDKILDMGCGIGGPARHIATFSDCPITGLNISRHQLNRCRDLSRDAKLDHMLSFVEGDFTCAPFEAESFDKIYAIEATCHCSQLENVYAEAYRLLKPGGLFALYEWCMTNKYDSTSKQHNAIKQDILEGDSLPDLVLTREAEQKMRSVGFELVEAEDLVSRCEVPWYSYLQARWSLSGFRMSSLGRFTTHLMLAAMEATGFAPKGVGKVHKMLCKGADGLVKGGEEGIFTPMFFMLGRKPAKSEETIPRSSAASVRNSDLLG